MSPGFRFAVLVAALMLGAVAPAFADSPRVGHRVENLVVPGSTLCPDLPNPSCVEKRQVKVHLWYPADQRGFSTAPATVYRSALFGLLLPQGAPLGWQVEAELARETDAIHTGGNPLPVIVFSHGSTNDPIDYAHTLEQIAGSGFVVVAPYHVNNTQDDARIDVVNVQAPGTLPCNDGRPGPCSRTVVARSMQDRVRDITYIFDALPGWFGDRVDVSRAGVLGHSRGTVTALAAAGGSAVWGFAPEPRVKAIMGLAIGARQITFAADLANVRVPAVLIAGGKDQNSVQAVSEDAFDAISSAQKLFVAIPEATHRSFDSTYCAQLRSAAAKAHGNASAVLDLHTVSLIGASAPGGLSGKAVHYCAARYFTTPVDVLLRSMPASEYPPSPSSICVTASVPCTGLDTEEVKQGVSAIATAFFGTALKRTGSDGIHFTRYLAPEWLRTHVPMVGDVRAYGTTDDACPPGQDVDCAD
jgi:predicted dienelactone hydrolase